MNDRGFRTEIERALLACGFEQFGKSLLRRDAEVWTLVETEKGFGQQRHINVGFWLNAVDTECPQEISRTHLYFRLERLFPSHHDAIARAGTLGEETQPQDFEAFTVLLRGEIDQGLRALGTVPGLREALTAGRLGQGLIRKEAREYLRHE